MQGTIECANIARNVQQCNFVCVCSLFARDEGEEEEESGHRKKGEKRASISMLFTTTTLRQTDALLEAAAAAATSIAVDASTFASAVASFPTLW